MSSDEESERVENEKFDNLNYENSNIVINLNTTPNNPLDDENSSDDMPEDEFDLDSIPNISHNIEDHIVENNLENESNPNFGDLIQENGQTIPPVGILIDDTLSLDNLSKPNTHINFEKSRTLPPNQDDSKNGNKTKLQKAREASKKGRSHQKSNTDHPSDNFEDLDDDFFNPDDEDIFPSDDDKKLTFGSKKDKSAPSLGKNSKKSKNRSKNQGRLTTGGMQRRKNREEEPRSKSQISQKSRNSFGRPDHSKSTHSYTPKHTPKGTNKKSARSLKNQAKKKKVSAKSLKYPKESKEEVDNRDFYLPVEKSKGGFTISRVPRFVNNYRNYDITG